MGLFKSREEKYQLGLKAYQAGDYVTAHKWIEKAAGGISEHAEAKFLYAEMMETGKNKYDSPDPALAAMYYKNAAELGHTEAQFRYGLKCFEGDEHVWSTDRYALNAQPWLQKAAKKGHAKAQFYCGWSLEKGLGVKENRAEALKYYLKSAEQGDKDAQCGCGRLIASTSVDGAKEEALNWYEKAAAQDQGEAQFACAKMYAEGIGTKKDTAKAYEMAKKAAEKKIKGAKELCEKVGKEEAVNILPAAIEACEAEDYKKALPIAEKAAEMGLDLAQWLCGDMYLKGQGTAENPEKAFYWFKKAAEQGDKKSQFQCGKMYDKGLGTDVDKKVAIYWMEKAAEQGNDAAAYYCAFNYYYSPDVPRDINKARKWAEAAVEKNPNAQKLLDQIQAEQEAYFKGQEAYEKGEYETALALLLQAAENGNVEASCICGQMYEKGLGTELDPVKALRLYEDAGEKGHAEAQFLVARFYEKWYNSRYEGEKKEYTQKKTLDWYLKAAAQGHMDAQFYAGVAYINGFGTEQNYDKAYPWLKKAAEQGMKEAQHNLAILYENGLGTEKSEEKALYWYEKAAEQDFIRSLNQCGLMYRYGIGTQKDAPKALEYYKRSAMQGDMEGEKEYGMMLYDGWDGIERDRKTAKIWIEKAAAQGDEGCKNMLREFVFH